MPSHGVPQILEGVPRLLNSAQTCKALGITRTTFFRCVARGEIRVVRLGGVIRVPVDQPAFGCGVSESAAQRE